VKSRVDIRCDVIHEATSGLTVNRNAIEYETYKYSGIWHFPACMERKKTGVVKKPFQGINSGERCLT
jgi:hypothetical protein